MDDACLFSPRYSLYCLVIYFMLLLHVQFVQIDKVKLSSPIGPTKTSG
jgi:hypothetical protein